MEQLKKLNLHIYRGVNSQVNKVYSSFNIDEELGKVGLTMEDVHRIQNQ